MCVLISEVLIVCFLFGLSVFKCLFILVAWVSLLYEIVTYSYHIHLLMGNIKNIRIYFTFCCFKDKRICHSLTV